MPQVPRPSPAPVKSHPPILSLNTTIRHIPLPPMALWISLFYPRRPRDSRLLLLSGGKQLTKVLKRDRQFLAVT